MNKKIIPFLIVVNLILFTKPLFADAVAEPNNQKLVFGYIKFQGWETVQNYILMQPTSEWSNCTSTNGIEVMLLNDGRVEDFGFNSKGGDYYGVVAIDRNHIGDIYFGHSNSFDDQTDLKDQNTYWINCASEAYKTAAFTNTVIPHGFRLIDDSNPIEREDFIVTIKGVDITTKKLTITVSDPISRTNLTDATAKAFVDSLVGYQSLDKDTATCQTRLSECQLNLTNQLQFDSQRSQKQTTNTLPVGQSDKSWGIFAMLSGTLITGLFGFLFGRIIGKKSGK